MFYQEITGVSIDSFRERSHGKKIVLLYPWTNYRNVFLGYFLEQQHGLLYYRVAPSPATLVEWVEGMVAELNVVTKNFGAHTRKALDGDLIEHIATAFAQDLNDYSRGRATILYLDELDRAPHDENFKSFMRTLVDALPNHVQIAVSSRLLTNQPWIDFVSKGVGVVLGTERRKNDLMFTLEEHPKPQVEIYALSRGYVLVNGQQITNWDGALPRNLFFFFVDRPLVTRDEIFQTFWPNINVKEATNVFHVTKRKISERISMKVEPQGSYELTQYNGGFYLPSDKIIRHYDVADFQEAIEQALVAKTIFEEELLLKRAIDLYRSSFLQSIEMEWVQKRREHLKNLFAQALISMGKIQRTRGNDSAALGYFSRAVKESPEREDTYREMMHIYLDMGSYRDGVEQYELLRKTLNEKLGIDPSPETKQLHSMLQSHL
jgi:two-component SAPR family response regulator